MGDGQCRSGASCALIDHAPELLPDRQLPVTIACPAFSKRSARRAVFFNSTPDFHEPENSCSLPPKFAARQLPIHPSGDFDADHPPLAIVVPCALTSVHVPVTVPLVRSGTAVHVPPNVRPLLLLAPHVP